MKTSSLLLIMAAACAPTFALPVDGAPLQERANSPANGTFPSSGMPVATSARATTPVSSGGAPVTTPAKSSVSSGSGQAPTTLAAPKSSGSIATSPTHSPSGSASVMVPGPSSAKPFTSGGVSTPVSYAAASGVSTKPITALPTSKVSGTGSAPSTKQSLASIPPYPTGGTSSFKAQSSAYVQPTVKPPMNPTTQHDPTTSAKAPTSTIQAISTAKAATETFKAPAQTYQAPASTYKAPAETPKAATVATPATSVQPKATATTSVVPSSAIEIKCAQASRVAATVQDMKASGLPVPPYLVGLQVGLTGWPC